MSKLYEALKRLNNENRSPNFQKFTKKPEKKNIKWYILFFVSIIIGSFLIYISNFTNKASIEKTRNTIKITKQINTNSTKKVSNQTNSTQPFLTKSNTVLAKTPLKTFVSKTNETYTQNQKNQTITAQTNKQKQLQNILHYQQEKSEKLSDLALQINTSLENGDYYRAKLLLKEYLLIQEDPFALNDLAAIYIKEGHFAQAAKLLQKSIEQEQSPAAYVNLIYCYKKLNEKEKLKELLKTINPSIFSDAQKAMINEIITSK